jgi:hypothetical protein
VPPRTVYSVSPRSKQKAVLKDLHVCRVCDLQDVIIVHLCRQSRRQADAAFWKLMSSGELLKALSLSDPGD